MSKFYTISLNSSLDYTFYLKNIIDDDVNRIEKIIIDPGGKGMNIARMLKKLGENPISITFIGGTTGKIYKNLLKKEKIDFLSIKIKDDLRKIYNFISEKRVLRFNEKGPKIKQEEIKKFWKILNRIKFNEKDYVIVSGSIPPGINNNIYAKIVKNLKKYNVYTCIDADGELLKKAIKEKPFLIKPNLQELERYADIKIRNIEILYKVLKDLANKIKIILVTFGEKGALLFTENTQLFSIPPKVRFKSSIGCGDAFLAGFLYKFKYGENLENCLKFAVACGSAKATKEGTKMPSFIEINNLLPHVKVNNFSNIKIF